MQTKMCLGVLSQNKIQLGARRLHTLFPPCTLHAGFSGWTWRRFSCAAYLSGLAEPCSDLPRLAYPTRAGIPGAAYLSGLASSPLACLHLPIPHVQVFRFSWCCLVAWSGLELPRLAYSIWAGFLAAAYYLLGLA